VELEISFNSNLLLFDSLTQSGDTLIYVLICFPDNPCRAVLYSKTLPAFQPGQYISVKVFVDVVQYEQLRQCSLSDKPFSKYYCISVKKETGLSQGESNTAVHPDYVSNILHYSKNRNIIKTFYLYNNIFYSQKKNS